MTGVTNISTDKSAPEALTKKLNSSVVPEQDFSMILDQALGKTNENLTDHENKMQDKKNQKEEEKDSLEFNPAAIVSLFNDLQVEKNTLSTTQDNAPAESNAKVNNLPTAKEPPQDDANYPNGLPVSWKPILENATENILSRLDIAKLLANYKDNSSLNTFILPEQQAENPPIPFKELYDTLVKEINSKKTQGLTRLKLALEPENLGKIDIYLFLDKNKLYISFAANEETRKLLMETRNDLAASLSQNGYEMADMNFTSSGNSDAFTQNFGGVEQKNDYNLLNIAGKKDIISGVNNLVSSIIVNYIA